MAVETKEPAAAKATTSETKEPQKAELSKSTLMESTGSTPSSWPGQALGETGRFLENLFSRDFPAVDMINRENDVLLRVELPSACKEDLQVIAGETSITIKGAMGFERIEEKGEYIRREIKHRQSFSRTLSLPVEVDPTKGKARYRDNILEVTLPRSAKLHTIKVE